MIKKILLVLLLLPIIYIVAIVVLGLLAGILGVTVYYCAKWLLIGLVVLAIVWLVSECLKSKE